MPCEPDLTLFSEVGAVTPMSGAEVAGGFGQCSDPKPTTGRLNWVLNWLTCHLIGVKQTADESHPCKAQEADAAELLLIEDASLAICIDGNARRVDVGDLPFQPSICSIEEISADELAALAADPATGKIAVCISDGTDEKVVSIALDDLPGSGGGGGQAGAIIMAALETSGVNWEKAAIPGGFSLTCLVAGDYIISPQIAGSGPGFRGVCHHFIMPCQVGDVVKHNPAFPRTEFINASGTKVIAQGDLSPGLNAAFSPNPPAGGTIISGPILFSTFIGEALPNVAVQYSVVQASGGGATQTNTYTATIYSAA